MLRLTAFHSFCSSVVYLFLFHCCLFVLSLHEYMYYYFFFLFLSTFPVFLCTYLFQLLSDLYFFKGLCQKLMKPPHLIIIITQTSLISRIFLFYGLCLRYLICYTFPISYFFFPLFILLSFHLAFYFVVYLSLLIFIASFRFC